MNQFHRLFRPSLVAVAIAAALASVPAQAATIMVDPTAVDEATAGDGKCSLREAVLSVNAGINVGDCLADDVLEPYGTNDTINLPAGTYTLTLADKDETYTDANPGDPAVVPVVSILSDATKGDLDITKSVRIVGAGATSTTIEWGGTTAATADRIFHIYDAAAVGGNVDVVIEGVKLTKGLTEQVTIKTGPASGSGALPTTYYLRRAGGAIAVGPAAAVVLVDPNITGTANSAGRGGSKKPGEAEPPSATYTLAMTGVTVDGNSTGGDGGGIYTASALTAANLVVSNNVGLTNGGAIYNEGNTSITTSAISGNRAEGGGGLFATGSNTVSISRVVFNGNRAVGGGAISGRAGVTMNIVNTTISSNIGKDVGAGLYTNGIANLNFVTIANNVAGADSPAAGSGVNLFPATSSGSYVNLKNTLLGGNKKGWVITTPDTDPMDPSFVWPSDVAIAALPSANCGVTGSGLPVTSLGSNLSSDTSCNNGTTVNWLTLASDKNNVDPQIGALADNGGSTLTHALLTGSPAIGAGIATSGVTTDQRGTTRNTTPDIGAYEVYTAPSSGGGGGGGCSTNPNAAFDPGLLALLGAALGGLFLRRRRQEAARR